MQCNAKSKRSGETCKGQAVTGSTKCRMHGGKTPSGLASPHYKHGKYSKYLNIRLQDVYAELVQDRAWGSLLEEIRLVEVMTVDKLGQLSAIPDVATLLNTVDALAGLVKDVPEAVPLVATLRTGLEGARSADAKVKDVLDLVDQKRALVATELNHRLKIGTMVEASTVMDTARRLVSIVTANTSHDQAVRIVEQFRSALNQVMVGQRQLDAITEKDEER